MVLGSLLEAVSTKQNFKIAEKEIRTIFDKYMGRKSPYRKDLDQLIKLRGDDGIVWIMGEEITKYEGNNQANKYKYEPLGNRLIATNSYKREHDGKLQIDIVVNREKFTEKYAVNPKRAIEETDGAVAKAVGQVVQRLKTEHRKGLG